MPKALKPRILKFGILAQTVKSLKTGGLEGTNSVGQRALRGQDPARARLELHKAGLRSVLQLYDEKHCASRI